MIVKISQTASNIKQTFDIESDNFHFYGELGSMSRLQAITLSNNFVLYYANYRFAERFLMRKGSYYEKSWSYSKYNDKYDPKWRETNFPDENFFGKTNLFKQ